MDLALAGVLTGHPRLLAYDIHALGEGADTIGLVTVKVAPPLIEGERGSGEYAGEARGANIIAASIEAYIAALNQMLAEEHWAGATDEAGNSKLGFEFPDGPVKPRPEKLPEPRRAKAKRRSSPRKKPPGPRDEEPPRRGGTVPKVPLVKV